MSSNLQWVRRGDLWYIEGLYGVPPVTAAHFDTFPPHIKNITVPNMFWQAANYAELMARAAGEKYAETWAMNLIQNGVPAVEAVRRAAAAAPPGKTAKFPQMAAMLEQGGQKQTAQLLRAGVQARPAPLSTSATLVPQGGSQSTAAASMPSPVLLIGLGLLVLVALQRRIRR